MRYGATILAAGWLALAAHGQEWTRFRGPNGTGVGQADKVPTTWGAQDFLWKTALPGEGVSSPVLWGDKVFVTCGDRKSGQRQVVCVDAASGKVLWKKEMAGPSYKMHKRNSVATSTPTVDGDRVYLCWAAPENLEVIALDHAGKEVWKTPLGPHKSKHGFGVSPILHGDLLILPNDQDKQGDLVALEKATGKVRWKIPRRSGNATYSTPCLYTPQGQDAQVIFTNWQHGITGVDPVKGKVLWEISAFQPDKAERAIASPIVFKDLILGTCGFVTAQKQIVAVRPEGDGKVKEVWRYEKAVAYMPTPVVRGDYLYWVSERGIASCVEGATGRIQWQERLDNEFAASPVCIGNHLFCPANDGEVFVLAAEPVFRVLGRNSLGERTQATPAVAGGRLIFRTDRHLLAVGGK